MKNQLDMILNQINFSDFKIKIINKKCFFPTANIYPNMEPPLIVVEANKPSLIRYALANLLLHERAHYVFHQNYPNFKGNHHNNKMFQRIERELQQEVDKLIFEEHD